MGFISGALLSVASAQSHQYYFVNTSLTWTEAQSVCRRDYTDLATIESTADVNDFLSTNSSYTGKAWIGLYDDTLNSWKWSLNDSSFYGPGEYSFRNWQPGQPDDYYGQQHCVQFNGSSVNSLGQWDDAGCMETMQFLCYNGTVGGSPSYVLSSISLTWTEAQKFCRENYVDLASVRNQTENDIIRTLIGSSTVWIGLYREKLWSDSSDSLFRYWADGEPFDPSGDQCVAGSFNDSGRWSDESCSLSLPFVCYKPSYVSRMKVQLTSQRKLSESEMEEVLAEVRLTCEKVYIF
uniref:C-type lectin domain-containing protein n=1 Tax=Poecilia mexicana TaxID=48701 RepID=A0A3B3YC91_9TELE